MHSWRISKYDPMLRDTKGSFPLDTWTSVADVGSTYSGSVLEWGTYLLTEDAYVSAILEIHAACGHPALRSLDVESRPETYGSDLPPVSVLEGGVVAPTDLPIVIRRCLREEMWCRFEDRDRRFTVHFGYDYYVYVACSGAYPDTVAIVGRHGLYAEAFESPYQDRVP
jgi:hypothetical protein